MLKSYLNDSNTSRKSLALIVGILIFSLIIVGLGIKVIVLDKALGQNPLSFLFRKPVTTVPVFLGKELDGIGYRSLYSKSNGKTYTIIDTEQKIPEKFDSNSFMRIDILAKRDFDNDGYTDYLIEFDTGGNGCPTSYAFVSAFPDGSSTISDKFGECRQWNKITTKDGRTGVLINGNNIEPPSNYFFKNGAVTSETLPQASNLTAEDELNFTQIDLSVGGELVKSWDLNDDGVQEVIHCESLRSGLMCFLLDSNGQRIPSGQLENNIIRRLGILETKTNGYHDLVVEAQDVYRWNGNTYVKNLLAETASTIADPSVHVKKENNGMDSTPIIGLLIMGILGLVCLGVYFLPTILAVAFKNKNVMAIAIINLLLGWVGIGWIIALIMAIWKREAQMQPVIYQGFQVAAPPEEKNE